MKKYPQGGLILGRKMMYWSNYGQPSGFYKERPFYCFNYYFSYSPLALYMVSLIETKIIPIRYLVEVLSICPDIAVEQKVFMFEEDVYELENELLREANGR